MILAQMEFTYCTTFQFSNMKNGWLVALLAFHTVPHTFQNRPIQTQEIETQTHSFPMIASSARKFALNFQSSVAAIFLAGPTGTAKAGRCSLWPGNRRVLLHPEEPVTLCGKECPLESQCGKRD